jgi:hypothetical protein
LKYSALLVLLFTFHAFSFDKDFTVINDRVPHEFTLLFNALKVEAKTPSQKLKMIGLSKELNENLGFLTKEHIFMLMKTEVIKSTLEYRFDKVRQFDMNSLLVNRLDDEFLKKKAYLNPFAQWIWQSVLAELKLRQESGIINNKSFNPNNFEGMKRAEAIRFQRYLNYLFPWIDRMDSLDATHFNQLTTDVSWLILNRLNERSVLFKRYASTAAGDTLTVIINIPQKLLDLHPEDIKKMQNDKLPLSLSEQSRKERREATDEMEKVTPLDMSPISDQLLDEIENRIEQD